jgi:hypothetical protein
MPPIKSTGAPHSPAPAPSSFRTATAEPPRRSTKGNAAPATARNVPADAFDNTANTARSTPSATKQRSPKEWESLLDRVWNYDENAKRELDFALRSNEPGAWDAVVHALKTGVGDRVPARAFQDNPGAIPPEALKALADTVIKGGIDAPKVLAGLADANPPVPGLAAELRRVAIARRAEDPRRGDDRIEQALQKIFLTSKDPAARAQAAPFSMGSGNLTPEQKQAALALTAKSAAAGDAAAIGVLKRAARAEMLDSVSWSKEHQKTAATALGDAAEQGHTEALEALLGFKSTGPGVAEGLARAASAMKPGDPALSKVLDSLSQGLALTERERELGPLEEDRHRVGYIGQVMGQVADKLRPQDIDTLVKSLPDQSYPEYGSPVAATLGKAARSISPEAREQLVGALVGQLQGGSRGEAAAQALGHMADLLTPAQAEALGASLKYNPHAPFSGQQIDIANALARVLMNSPHPEGQVAAARSLATVRGVYHLSPEARERIAQVAGESGQAGLKQKVVDQLQPKELVKQLDNPNMRIEAGRKLATDIAVRNSSQVTGDDRRKLIDVAASSGDAQLKEMLFNSIPGSPLSNQKLEGISDAYNQRLITALRNAKEGEPMYELAEVLRAKSLATDEKWGKHTNTAALDQKVAELFQKEPLKGQLEDIRQKSIRDVLGENPGEDMVQYLTGDSFKERLKLLSPEEQRNEVQAQLQRLALVSPQKAQQMATQLGAELVRNSSVATLQALPRAQRESAILDAIKTTAEGAGQTLDVPKNIADLLDTLEKNKTPEQAAQALLDAANKELAKATGPRAESLRKTVQFLRDANSSGKLPSIIVGANLIALAAGGIPEGGADRLKCVTTLMKCAGNSADVAKLFGHNIDELEKLSKLSGTELSALSKSLKFAKVLGPIADLANAGIDGYSGIQELKTDGWGGAITLAGAAGSAASGIAGLCILAGATGPAAPAVMVVGAVVSLGAWGAHKLFAKEDEQKLLEKYGAYVK